MELNLAPYLMGHVVSNYVLKQLFDDRSVRCTIDLHIHLVEIQRQTRSVTGIIKSPYLLKHPSKMEHPSGHFYCSQE